MADYDEVVVLHESYESRTSSSGKTRFKLKVSAESLVCHLDPKRLARGPAEAIAELLKERVKAITAAAAPATLKARKVAAKALAAGKAWAQKRYAGGRIGQMAPNQSMTQFDDSGRFIESIRAAPTKDGWMVNVAANRLNSETAGASGVQAIYQRLIQLVPEFADAAKLLSEFTVQRAIQVAVASVHEKLAAGANARVRELYEQFANIEAESEELASKAG